MDAGEPRARHRGFFLHSDTGEPDTGELENPEGFIVRAKVAHSVATAKRTSSLARVSGSRFSGGRSRTSVAAAAMEHDRMGIRSRSVTGSRQRAHMPR